MAEAAAIEPEAVDEEQESGAKKGKGKLIIIIAVVLLLVGGGAGAYFGGFIGGKAATAEEGAEGEEAHAEEGAHDEEGGPLTGPFFYDLKEFVVNLNVGSQSPSFLKMTVTLELKSELDVPKLEVHLPRVRDSFHIYIRELRKSDLRGSEGVYRLREELLLRVNKIAHPIKIKEVLFKEILIQ